MSATIITPQPDGAITAHAPGRITPYLIRSALVASLCGLLFGFETAVISGTTEWLKGNFSLSDFQLGFTVAMALLGSIVGAFAIGKPTDVYGRRAVLFALALLFMTSALGCALAWSWGWFLLFRFIGGLAVGGASVAAPVYIAELSPAAYRGRLVTITQLNIVLGVLLAYLSNYVIGLLSLGDHEARWMFGVMSVPAAIFFLLLFSAPQSPRWLIARGRTVEARSVLRRCGTDTGSVEAEIAEIGRSFTLAEQEMKEPLLQRKYLRLIGLAVAIAAFNQLSGINALLYYTRDIFALAGADKASALLQSVIVGLTLLVCTAAALSLVDHLGRRKLMVIGSIGYIVSLSTVAYALSNGRHGGLLLASLLVFVASHAFGQGSVIWVFISEIFPNTVRARGQALGVGTHWLLCAAVSWTFPVFAAVSSGAAFALFAFCMVGQLLWALFVMPETKGIPLEQIQLSTGSAPTT